MVDGNTCTFFKKGDLTGVNSYRAITLVSCMAKLFTNIINKRICEWAEKNDTISDAQFGFRKGISTTYALFIRHAVV